MLLHTEKGKVTKVEGDPKHPVSRGWTCSWGRAAVVSRYRQGIYNIINDAEELRKVK